MHRYQSSSMFFDIALAGKTIKTTAGKLGKPGKTEIKKYTTEAAAKAAHDELVTAKTKNRYELVPATPIASTRTFEHGAKTWELTLDGLRVTAGKTVVEHATSAEALAAYNKKLAEKLKAGFVERTPRNPELERAIASDLYDALSYGSLAIARRAIRAAS